MPPFHAVPKQPDHVDLEHRVLERWHRERTFERLREQTQTGEPWSFIDGPITANNPMGVHHAWGRTLKDLWSRYRAMNGRRLRWQNGFDCQGLWVEVEVEKALGLNSKREIEDYGLDKFSRDCRARVATYGDAIAKQSERLGQWMDWERSYFTMTDPNISYIWTFLAECHRRGWLYRGHRSMPWCPRCGTALSQHELIDSYEEITHPSLFVRFPIHQREREYLAVWTTTPWTLPANVAAAVHPDEDYVRVETLVGVAIVAEARLEHLPFGGKVLETLKGADLVGLTYDGPFDDLPAQQGVEHRVVAWDEVSMEEGTGVVHIAPGCGAEDFELGKREGLPALIPIDESGAFFEQYGWLHGNHAGEAAHPIIDDMGRRGRVIEAGELTHRYPTCWRCGTELLYRLVDEWFIRCDEIREPMIAAARTVEWTPPQYGKRMEDWLRNMGDWCISRRRYWGLPLPFWFCDDGHMTLISSKQELLTKAIRGAEQLPELHRPWIDEVVVPCAECGEDATRTPDVGDAWLDAGIVPYSTLGWRNQTYRPEGYAEGAGVGLTKADLPDGEYWETWFPADWVSEMREQIRLWFYSMLFMSVTLDGRSPYRRVLTYERVTDETGRAMHKSWGNAIWFDDAVETMGADAMRWMYAAQTPSENLHFGYGPASEVKRKLLTLWNCYSFFISYASIDGYEPRAQVLGEGPDLAGARPLDRWMLATTQELIRECREALDAFDSPRLVRAVERFWDDLSNWYLRLSRARFYGADDTADKRAAYETLWYALCQVTRLMSPVVPFVTDEMWTNLVAPAEGLPDSVHLSGYPVVLENLADPDLQREMRDVRTVVELGRAARGDANIKVRQPLRAVIVATEDKGAAERIQRQAELIAAELNVKEVRLTSSSEDFAQVEVVPNFKVIGPKHGKDAGEINRLLRAGEYERTADGVTAGRWTLGADEYEVRTRAREGFAVVDGDGFAAALDTEITPELKLEGEARDVIRRIQDLRKQADLALTDRITITYPADLAAVFETHGAWIGTETLSTGATPGDAFAVAKS